MKPAKYLNANVSFQKYGAEITWTTRARLAIILHRFIPVCYNVIERLGESIN